jgi:Uma2 family endonuclease
MCALPKQRWTEADYLKFDRSSEDRFEFIDGDIVAMSGGSERHARISMNTARSLGNQLDDRPCTVYGSDMRVRVLPGRQHSYPDVTVVCGSVILVNDGHGDTLVNPTVIVEVLSPSTEAFDRGKKFTRYRNIDSLQEYVLIAQDHMQIERFVRQPDNQWTLTDIQGVDGSVKLTSIDCALTTAAVYKNVQFDPGADDG